jgi:hypothetical protein
MEFDARVEAEVTARMAELRAGDQERIDTRARELAAAIVAERED